MAWGEGVATSLMALAMSASPGVAAAQADVGETEAVIVTGAILRSDSPGSNFVISRSDLDAARPLSVKDVLRLSPGVQVVDEDIFGLKLNISLRGLPPRRSGRTLLLEDGMPIQPAPYSEPSAHYSPSLARIERIEIVKGSGEILDGPQSLGGMINFVTRPAPRSRAASAELAFGTRGYASTQLSLGGGTERGGFVLDAETKRSDGVRRGHDTRYGEVALKGEWALSDRHGLTARLTHHVEASRLTEAGLDARRYAEDPYGNPFENDRFELRRTAVQLIHDARWSPSFRTRIQLYDADTFRASYRQTDTSTDTMIARPATGCVGARRLDYEGSAHLCGNKMRPRDFQFRGAEARAFLEGDLWGARHEAVLGIRKHHEDVDRRRYDGLTPAAREGTVGTLLRDHNLIEADALALYGLDTVMLGPVAISLGLRSESIQTRNTSIVANFTPRRISISKAQTIMLPGAGLTWRVSPGTEIFAGAHKGFAPPRPDRDVDPLLPANQVRPEESVNTELGLRARPGAGLRLEATLFAMNFSELIVSGPLLGLPSGSIVNAGRARHAGAELFMHADLGKMRGWDDNPWVSASLTLLPEAVFLSDAGDGQARVKGKRIPYAPRAMAELGVGLETASGLSMRLGLNHVGEQFADAANTMTPSSDGMVGLIPAHTTYTMAMTWSPKQKDWSVFLAGQNLADSRFISARTDGLFAGQRRHLQLGIRWGG